MQRRNSPCCYAGFGAIIMHFAGNLKGDFHLVKVLVKVLSLGGFYLALWIKYRRGRPHWTGLFFFAEDCP